jgi:predicted glycosyltransferase
MPEPTIDFGPVEFIQLNPVKTDPEFKILYDDQGQVIDDDFKESRKNRLLDVVNRVRPKLVIIETYPFGRRQMRFELLPLLRHLRYGMVERPLVSCSIRDVIQPKNSCRRIQEVNSIVDEYFDIVFVHGDQSFIAFEQTFPQAAGFRDKITYTGYVVKPMISQTRSNRRKNTILVSAGGGAVGQRIYQTVVEASDHGAGKEYHWHMLVGNNYSATQFSKLAEKQHEHLRVERNRDDFLQLLSRCSVSISQAGYNTIMDLLVTKTPALVIPFEGVGEKEQLIRSGMLEQHRVVKVLREKNLNAENLVMAVKQALTEPNQPIEINLQGAERMYEIVNQKLRF